jgi:nitrogen-specific signal transduction histidine kinase
MFQETHAMNPKLPTEFAPAERSTPTEVQGQSYYFSNIVLLHQFLDAVPTVCLVLNEQRQVILSNRALSKLTNISKEQLSGLRVGEALNCTHAFETAHGCGTTEFCSTCGAVKATLASLRGCESIQECRISQRSGDALDLRVWATPLAMDGEKYSFFAVTDISHEKRRKALERIFFHDVLNTAGVLYGVSDILPDVSPTEQAELTHVLQLRSKSLIDEIQAHRQLVAAENNELAIDPTPIPSLTFLRDTIASYQAHKVAMERHLQLAPGAQEIVFISDETLLRRVIENLVKNALEAAQPGDTVTVGCNRLGNTIDFWVHNPAVMPRNVQLQMFQRSFSTKGPDRGLGAYSIKLLTERYLNGSVSFTSTPEHGTTFTARYPLNLERPDGSNKANGLD